MSRTLFKLRMFGIAAFVLFILSAMFGFPPKPGFSFNLIQQILILVSFVIFAILIVVHVYIFYIKYFVKEEEEKADV